MAKESEERSDYFESVTVEDKEDARILASEYMWDILQYVHGLPDGVRPEDVSKEYDIRLTQAYDKLRTLEKRGYLRYTKQRGKPGKDDSHRKTLLYISSPWGRANLEEDFADTLTEKYGEYIMTNICPKLNEFFELVLSDMKKDKQLHKWYPAPHKNLCPDCEQKHQAVELYRALMILCLDVVEAWSYVYSKNFLNNGYLSRKAFDKYTKRSEKDYEWAFSDNRDTKK